MSNQSKYLQRYGCGGSDLLNIRYQSHMSMSHIYAHVTYLFEESKNAYVINVRPNTYREDRFQIGSAIVLSAGGHTFP